MWGKIITIFQVIRELISLGKVAWKTIQDMRRAAAKKELKEKLDETIKTGDQRTLEEAIGSSNAGKPTKHRIDGLRERPQKDRGGNMEPRS